MELYPHSPQRAPQRPKAAQAYRELRETGVTADELLTAARHYRTDPALVDQGRNFWWAMLAANFLRKGAWREYLEPRADAADLLPDGTPLFSGQIDPRTRTVYYKAAPRPVWMFPPESSASRELAGVES